MVVFFTIVHGFSWVKYWQIWAVFLLTSAAIYAKTYTRAVSVGAEWFSVSRSWVSTYDLVRISYRTGIRGTRLTMRDSEGRRLSVKLEEIQADRAIWDYCFSGMLHSVVSGRAQVNARVHLDLHIPYRVRDV
jgi:hypothetical protein